MKILKKCTGYSCKRAHKHIKKRGKHTKMYKGIWTSLSINYAKTHIPKFMQNLIIITYETIF